MNGEVGVDIKCAERDQGRGCHVVGARNRVTVRTCGRLAESCHHRPLNKRRDHVLPFTRLVRSNYAIRLSGFEVGGQIIGGCLCVWLDGGYDFLIAGN